MPNERPRTSACYYLILKLTRYIVLRPHALYLELFRRLLDNATDSETGVHVATGHALLYFLPNLFAKCSADRYETTALNFIPIISNPVVE